MARDWGFLPFPQAEQSLCLLLVHVVGLESSLDWCPTPRQHQGGTLNCNHLCVLVTVPFWLPQLDILLPGGEFSTGDFWDPIPWLLCGAPTSPLPHHYHIQCQNGRWCLEVLITVDHFSSNGPTVEGMRDLPAASISWAIPWLWTEATATELTSILRY